MNEDTGEVLMQRGAAPGRHELTVRVREQTATWDVTVDAIVVVDVVYIDDEALARTGSVRLEGVTGAQFITREDRNNDNVFSDSMGQVFAQTMASLLDTEPANVQVLGVVDVPGALASVPTFTSVSLL